MEYSLCFNGNFLFEIFLIFHELKWNNLFCWVLKRKRNILIENKKENKCAKYKNKLISKLKNYWKRGIYVWKRYEFRELSATCWNWLGRIIAQVSNLLTGFQILLRIFLSLAHTYIHTQILFSISLSLILSSFNLDFPSVLDDQTFFVYWHMPAVVVPH